MLENKFSKLLKKELEAIPRSWWFRAPTRSRRGIPDWLGCVNGHFVALELKRSKAKPDKSRETLQRYIIDQINTAGGVAFFGVTPDNKDDVLKTLKSL